MPPNGSRSDTFSLVFKYGVEARNVLDTDRGSYTKDMIVDPSITIELKLTRDDLDLILAKMNDIDFWSYPKILEYEVPADVVAMSVTPYGSYYFKVQRGTTVMEVNWEDEHQDQSTRAARLRELTVLICSIIESKPEYRSLPEPRGGYM